VHCYYDLCLTCAKCKPKAKPRAPLWSFTSGNPMQRIHIDIVATLPRSRRGNRYILTVQCSLTNRAEVFAMSNQGRSVTSFSVDWPRTIRLVYAAVSILSVCTIKLQVACSDIRWDRWQDLKFFFFNCLQEGCLLPFQFILLKLHHGVSGVV